MQDKLLLLQLKRVIVENICYERKTFTDLNNIERKRQKGKNYIFFKKISLYYKVNAISNRVVFNLYNIATIDIHYPMGKGAGNRNSLLLN